MAESIRVVVADDHELVRSGICRALEGANGIKVVAEASDGLAVLEVLERQEADVLLLDIRMPHLDGLACLERVRETWPHVKVLMLTVDEDPGSVANAFDCGATGYILKAISPSDLAAAIREAVNGNVIMRAEWIDRPTGPTVANAQADRPPQEDWRSLLTFREHEVLDLVAQGHTNGEIGKILFVSTKTVKFHLTNVFAKLGVANRTEAAARALRGKGRSSCN